MDYNKTYRFNHRDSLIKEQLSLMFPNEKPITDEEIKYFLSFIDMNRKGPYDNRPKGWREAIFKAKCDYDIYRGNPPSNRTPQKIEQDNKYAIDSWTDWVNKCCQ